MPTIPCPGRCNAAWRRAEELGEPHSIQAVPGEPVHCWSCYATAHTQLHQLPALFEAIFLEGLDGTVAKLVGTIGRIGLQAPPWPGQHARLFADNLSEGILTLANDVREHKDEPVENGTSNSASTERAISTLNRHLRWLLTEHPCATESHDAKSGNPAWEIYRWHRSAEAFCKQDEQREPRRMVACPKCRDPWMKSLNGAVECTNPMCRNVMTNDEYARHVTVVIRAAKFAGLAA